MSRTRSQVAVVIRWTFTHPTEEERTVFYGPFLPHAGAAVNAFLDNLWYDAEYSDNYDHEAFVEPLFMGEDESDCRIEATR